MLRELIQSVMNKQFRSVCGGSKVRREQSRVKRNGGS